MTNVIFNDETFIKDMHNILNYSIGFLEGSQAGKPEFLRNFGRMTSELAKEYIDSMSRVDPASLSHVYEWYQNGSPNARLFDIEYKVVGSGLSFASTFSQSRSIQTGSNIPFYNKAEVMESGTPVLITPKSAKALAFNDNGEDIFVKGPVKVDHPGGIDAIDGLKNALISFFDFYFTQAFLQTSGIGQALKNPIQFKTNFKNAKTGGKSAGFKAGYQWITEAGAKE